MIFPVTCMMAFFAKANPDILSQNRGRKFQKLEKFLLKTRNTKIQNFSPLASLGANKKTENFLKLRESPFPLYPPPRSTLNGSISPSMLCLGGRQNWPKPKIFNLRKIFNFFSHGVYDDVFS